MNIYRVNDVSLESICSEQYDAIFVASGYEERCTFLSERASALKTSNPIICGFSELHDTEERRTHDRYLMSRWQTEVQLLSSEGESTIYKTLRDIAASGQKIAHILVDYSSMSRLWYAAILNWARFGNGPSEVTIDFAYSIGEYEEGTPPMIIGDMLAVPGCEGAAMRIDKSVAVFGLGFNGWAALSVLERLEADVVYTYMASPAANDTYPELVLAKNKDLLEEPNVDKTVLAFPLKSIETSYRYLSELITPHRTTDAITLVPMGPKPHVLASILVSMRFPQIYCLRVSAQRQKQEKVKPTGEIITTRVVIRK